MKVASPTLDWHKYNNVRRVNNNERTETERNIKAMITGKAVRIPAGSLPLFLKVSAVRCRTPLRRSRNNKPCSSAPLPLQHLWGFGNAINRSETPSGKGRTFWKPLVCFLKDETMSLKHTIRPFRTFHSSATFKHIFKNNWVSLRRGLYYIGYLCHII